MFRRQWMSILALLFLGIVFEYGCSSGNGSNPASTFVDPQSNATPQHPYLTQWGGSGNLNKPVALAVNSAGTTIYVADQNDNSIKAYSSTGTLFTQWFVAIPTGVSVDPNGNVYVTSGDGNDIIEKFDAVGNLTAQGGGVGTGSGKFSGPMGTACNGTTLMVADVGNNLVQAVTFVTVTPTPPATVVAFGVVFLNEWSGLAAGGVTFNAPQNIAINSAGTTFYVADTGNSLIQAYSPMTGFLGKWGGIGINSSQFNKPQGIAVSSVLGNVYVADTQNNRVQIFNSVGNYLYQFGYAGSGVGGFNLPEGVAVDASGYIYVADTGNNLIQKFGP